MNENIVFHISHETFTNFKNIINEVINELSNLKIIEYENEILDLFKTEKDEELFPEFLFFTNFPKLVTLNMDYIFNENKYILNFTNELNINNIENLFNKNIYKILLHMQIFLLSKIEIIISSIKQKYEDSHITRIKLREINQLFQILIQMMLLLFRFYKEKILNLNKILLFSSIIIIFLNKDNIFDDVYLKLKNMIFLDLLFEKYFGYFLTSILNNQDNKNDIFLFFNYIFKVINGNELEKNFIFQILSSNKIIEKLISNILNNINIDLFHKYNDVMINCFAKIYNNNTAQFKFFELLINQNKKSFINLMNYKTRKDYIIKDIYTQNFYLELIYKLFSKENNNNFNNIKTEKNYFRFNGYNSKLTFILNEFSLNNSIIFFSFQLSKDVKNLTTKNFPLIYFHSQSEKQILFKLTIQKENDGKYKLNIYQEKDEKKKKIKSLDSLGNIQLNINYLISIKFLNKKIGIYLMQLTGKNQKFFEESEILEIDNDKPVLKIGHDDKNNEYLKGYIGDFIVIKNLEIKKHINVNDIINYILDLKSLYKFFPLFFSESSIYNFDEIISFSCSKEDKEFNNIKNFLCDNIENFKCEIYLTTEIIGVYYSLFWKNQNEENYTVPEIPNITLGKKYSIININVSLVKISSIYNDFLRNNGFNYLVLIYEYYYNFFKLLENDKNEYDFYLKDSNLTNIIIKSINFTLLILRNNYTYYKYIISYNKEYKTLFRNLYEILKSNSNNIFFGISKKLYELIFEFKNELNSIKIETYKKPDDKYLSENETVIANFSEGLMNMICNYELYLNSQENNNLNVLFNSLIIMIDGHRNNKDMNEKFPFEQDFFYKIINFIKVLENSFTDDYENKKDVIKSYFDLIKNYLKVIDDEDIKKSYFRQLFTFIIKNYGNNFKLIINALNFIYEMIWEKFNLEKEDMDILLNLYSSQKSQDFDENDKIKNKFIDDINIIIFKILAKFSFIDNSNEFIEKLNSYLENLISSEVIFSNIITEIARIFNYFLKIKSIEGKALILNDKINHMEIFFTIFNFIFDLFKLIIKKKEKISQENTEKINDNNENEKFSKLINLLENLLALLKSDLNIKINNINCSYCLINFLIFYYRIIFYEKEILLNSEIKFAQNLIQLMDLCNEYFLLNCTQIFKFKICDCEYQKTIIEIIYEFSIQYFLNDENSEKCYDLLLQNYNFIFYDRQFIDNKKYSIFYVNDHLRYFLSKKKLKLKDNALKHKCEILEKYNNEFFDKEDKFIGNMTTYFLPIFIESQKKINNQQTFKKAPIPKLSKFLDDLFSLTLEEHSELYNLDKKLFFKTITSNYQNELINYIKEKYIKKKTPPSIDDIKKSIEIISEKFNKDSTKLLNNIKEILDENKINSEQAENLKDVAENQEEIPKIDYKIQFFYDLDKNYVTNIKKEIMNCIFSTYYLDELFYSQDFCIIKKYYINNYLKSTENSESKKLNFPSIIKNYRNNLEPPLFIKKFNNYIIDPYFPITHSYINKDPLKNKLTKEKSIKIFPKEFPKIDYDNEFECEILKNESIYYGRLYYNETKNFILFKEKEIDFLEEEGFEHYFLLSYMKKNLYDKDDDEKKGKEKIFTQRNFFKNLFIILDDIEEIIEIRIFLLWKGCEIYLKNGKSYIFNFLTTKEYDNFMQNILNKSKIKILIRKRNFLTDKNNITKIWAECLLSNFDYLLILNRYSSRSYNDPTQYPIFPWLLNEYKDLILFNKNEKIFKKIKDEFEKIRKREKKNETLKSIKIRLADERILRGETKEDGKLLLEDFINSISKTFDKINDNSKEYKDSIENAIIKLISFLRNFKYPLSAQDEQKRKNVLKRFKGDQLNEVKFPIHSGCHYSNIGFIYYYLMRQQPYDNLLVKLQEFILENPNRMFLSLDSLQETTRLGYDNRELIPEFFSKIENFLNLNCDLYGYLTNNKKIVDDINIKKIIYNQEKSYLSMFVSFILQHKKLLNSRLIGFHLRKWIDIIFGAKQLPPKNERKESFNIYSKGSYEQMTNLEKKLANNLSKQKENPNLTNMEIKKKINVKKDYIINFGVAPSQLFHENHPKLKWEIKDDNIKEKQYKKEDKEKNIEDDENLEFQEEDDIESSIMDYLTPQKLSFPIKGDPLYFKINPTINKIFVYNKENDLIILDCQLFNEINYKYFSFIKYKNIENSNILFSQEEPIYQIKNGFCSFDRDIDYYNDIGNYHTYYYNKINYLLHFDKIINDSNKYDFKNIKIITCRHIDFSFKIHYLDKSKNQKKKNNKQKNNLIQIYSFICEDFVTSCCCISSNAFIIGLNNGKLIYYILKENQIVISNSKKKVEVKTEINIKKEKYIQGHLGKINSIEIDKRLGIVITSGDDNYIFLRKLYDFELLLPIKIKSKYKVLLTKISSFNFLYILCFNKQKNRNIIFGYTLSGMNFAKSAYGLYDNINFTEDGNIITMNNKKEFIILSGSDLTKLNIPDDEEIMNNLKEIKCTNWLQFDYFLRGQNEEFNEIITFFENKDGNTNIRAINMCNL